MPIVQMRKLRPREGLGWTPCFPLSNTCLCPAYLWVSHRVLQNAAGATLTPDSVTWGKPGSASPCSFLMDLTQHQHPIVDKHPRLFPDSESLSLCCPCRRVVQGVSTLPVCFHSSACVYGAPTV